MHSNRYYGCNEIIKNGKTTIIIPTREIDELKTAMKLIFKDSKIRNYMISNARDSVAKKYEQSFVWEKQLEFYKEIELKNKL